MQLLPASLKNALMTYSTLFFGKELTDLFYNDIEKFFLEEKEESNKIEFKSYFSSEEKNHTEKENGVIRAICALLNSEGGLVIWGAPVGQMVIGKKEKIFKGDLSPCDKLIEKDSFVSRLTDLITPSPKGILFQRLESDSKYIYIIEVERSFYAPHQFRNIYYMRIDGQTKPAPHHYIEALFRKVSFPKLEGYIKIDSYKEYGNRNILTLSYLIFNKSKLQNEHDIYYRLVVLTGRFNDYQSLRTGDKIYDLDGHELRVLNAKSTLYYNEPILDTATIVIESNELLKTNYECEIMFYFGGRQSPLMISEYKLLLNNLDDKNTNSYFIEINENKYSYEYSDSLSVSEKDTMKEILGR